MELFQGEDGYIPLLPNLEGYWEKSLNELPSELRKLVTDDFQFSFAQWDDLTVEVRKRQAAWADYQRDPVHEPSLYFNMVVLLDELQDWIKKASAQGNDSRTLALREVVDRLEEALKEDRAKVGKEIQALRKAVTSATGTVEKSTDDCALDTREKTSLLILVAILCKQAKVDLSKPSKAAEIIRHAAELDGLTIGKRTIEEHLKKIPDAVARKKK